MDLRHSVNLSLVLVIDSGGAAGCNDTYVFDKTTSEFERYGFNADFSIGNDVREINRDGRSQLVMWAPIGLPLDDLSRQCEWPMVFAWTGAGYYEVSAQYKSYYERYLKSLNKQIANSHSPTDEEQAVAAAQAPEPQRNLLQGQEFQIEVSNGGVGGGHTAALVTSSPAAPSAVSMPEPDLTAG